MNLPVHPTQVNTAFFVHNPPNQYPNFPVLPVPPMLQQNNLTEYVLGLTAMYIQQGAGQNPARTFFANLVSRDNWQNREAAQLVGTVFEHVVFALATAGHNANVDEVIKHIVGVTVQQMVAINVANYQEGMAQFIPPSMGDQLNNVLNDYGRLRQDVENFNRQGYNNGGGGYGAGNVGTGFQDRNRYPGAVGGGYTPPTGVPGVGRMHRAVVPRNTTAPTSTKVGYDGGFRGSSTPARSERLTPRFIGTGPAVEPATPTPVRERVVEISGAPNRPVTVVREPVHDAGRPIIVNGRTIPSATPSVPFVAPTSVPAPAPVAESKSVRGDGFTVVDKNDPYSEIIWDNGSVLRLASTSGWERTFTTKNPYNTAYNPTTHALFHLRSPDGVVQEILQEKSENMEQYLDHEQDPELRAAEASRLAAKKGKSMVDWNLMTNLKPAAGKPYSIKPEPVASEDGAVDVGVEDGPDVSDSKLVRIDNVVSAHDVRSAETVVTVAHPEIQELLKTQTVEFYVEAVTLRLSSTDLSDVIKELAQCASFEELTEKLNVCRTQFPDDKDVWDEIEKRLTETLNRILNIGFGINWTVGSFSEDAVAVGPEILENYGADVASVFDHSVMNIIDLGLCTSGPGVEDRLASDSPDVAAVDAPVQNVVSFADRSSVTKIPYTFDDLNVKFDGIAVVERGALPDLHRLITAIFDRTQDLPVAFKHRLIKTSDGVWLSLYTALLNEGSYLISRHTF